MRNALTNHSQIFEMGGGHLQLIKLYNANSFQKNSDVQ